MTADKTTIQNGSFALDRQLYNVYSDGSNSNLPFAGVGAATPVTSRRSRTSSRPTGSSATRRRSTDVDPLSPTGATYGAEIDATITANGFFPFNLGCHG